MFCSCHKLSTYDLDYEKIDQKNDIENNVSEIKNLNLSNEIKNNNYGSIKYQEASKLYRDHIGYTYINRYYRIGYNFKECLQSLFFCHNESVNIWSHLISFIVFCGLLIINNIYFIKEVWLTNLVIIGSLIIFFVSTICHLFNPMFNSIKTHKMFYLLDFTGIMIGVIIFETVLFFLLLSKQREIFYILFGLCVLFNLSSVAIKAYFNINNDSITKPNFIYYILIVINFILILVCFLKTTTQLIYNFNVIIPFSISNFALIISIIYNLVNNYPEKSCGNRFDLCCSSHQIWHFVVSLYLLSLLIQVIYWINYLL